MNQEETFSVNQFNTIEDEENYYLFRALNNADNRDIEEGAIIEDGNFTRIRTDRERWEEDPEKNSPKYTANSEISLEEVHDHIKMRYRKDTNCISLSSNSNVSIVYGRGNYADRYVLVRVPKREMGEKVFNAGQYMLQEIEKSVNSVISQLGADTDSEILEKLSEVDNVKTVQEINYIVQELYSKVKEQEEVRYRGKKVDFASKVPVQTRISNYQSLNEEQTLEKNKIIAKLTILELNKKIKPLISYTLSNANLIRTLGNAFASSEQIYYGDIPGDRIKEVPKEIMDMFALLQQEDKNNPSVIAIKTELLRMVNEGYHIEEHDGRVTFTNGTETIDLRSLEESFLYREDEPVTDTSIEDMYEITQGRIDYGKATELVKKLFYLSKSRGRAREFAEILNKITGENPEYLEAIQHIAENGFEIEPAIITRINNKGYKLSEAVNLDLKKDELDLVEYIKSLNDEELTNILIQGGMSDINEMISRHFSSAEKLEPIDKNTYYANAIIDTYNWEKVGIEFTEEEREEISKRIQEKDCVKIYNQLKEAGVEEKDITTVMLNITTRERYANILEEGNIPEILNELKQDVSIEQIEKFIGYYDIPNTGITLKEYQQRAVDNVDALFEEKKFASVILPTGAGKSYVAIDELLKHKEEPMIYFAPSNEILEQIKNKIVEKVHGREGTLGKSKDKIVAEVFPNLQFETYQSLLFKPEEELQESKYKFIVLDELHRTGATEWEKKLDKLLEAQDEEVRVLGITATPQRDRGGDDMAAKTAQKLGYTEEEIKDEKHIAMKMDLIDAIRAGIVVNPLLVSCEYSIMQDGTLDELLEKIQSIPDEEKRNELETKYNRLRKNLQNAKGIPELLEASITKKDGKYIVFIPVQENGEELEDEEGNKIGKKKTKQKVEEAQKQIAEYLKNIDSEPEFYSMLGEYGNKKNAEELQKFEKSKSEHIKVMVVINKLNEGIHVDGIDGIIWQRALDEESKILLLQQLGRCIYAIDEDNPKDRPIVIDLPNNMLKIDLNKEINTYTPKDDLTLLEEVVYWVHMHNEHLPDINSTSKEEERKARTLKRIKAKYEQYLAGFEELEEDEIRNIEKIISTGAEIDLWNEILPDKEGEDKTTDIEIDAFELRGELKELYEFEREVDEENDKTTYEEIIKWLEKNNGTMPRGHIKRNSESLRKNEMTKEESYEINLYGRWYRSQEKKILEKYEGQLIEEVPEEYREKIAKLREYGLGKKEKTVYEEIIEWLEKNNGIMPRKDINKNGVRLRREQLTQEELYEVRLQDRWIDFIKKYKLEGYADKKIEEVSEKYREKIKRLRALIKHEKTTYEEIIEWLVKHNGKLPKSAIFKDGIFLTRSEVTEEEKHEVNLCARWKWSEECKMLEEYVGRTIEEVPEEWREKIAKLREYGLGKKEKTTYEKIIEWLEEHNGDLPKKRIIRDGKETTRKEMTDEEKYEIDLRDKWIKSIEKEKLDGYAGRPIEDIPEEYREKIAKLREYGLGKKEKTTYEQIIEWLEEHNGELPHSKIRRYGKCLKREAMTDEERRGAQLYMNWRKAKEKRILDEYTGKPIEEVPEEYREKIAKLREFGLGLSKKNVKAQDIGKATFDAPVEMCDKAQEVLDDLIQTREENRKRSE